MIWPSHRLPVTYAALARRSAASGQSRPLIRSRISYPGGAMLHPAGGFFSFSSFLQSFLQSFLSSECPGLASGGCAALARRLLVRLGLVLLGLVFLGSAGGGGGRG